MIDDPSSPEFAAQTPPSGRSAEGTISFCQQCGRGLTASTQRRVGAAIFCEPCAAARAAQAQTGWTSVNGAYRTTPPPPFGASSAEPNPVLAGFFGLIPGVGAMFNGQYAKGVIHLIVFVVLVSLADNLNWVFWWLVWGWIFYQAFEAYHTAQARRDGQPLPDPFGWNELGERFGFARTWPATPPVPPAPTASPNQPPPGQPFGASASAFSSDSFAGAPPFSSSSARNPGPGTPDPYFGDIPPTHATPHQPPPYGPGTTQIPYSSIYTGPAQPLGNAPACRRFPVGATWLIACGLLFLIGNILPTWHLDGRWMVPLLLAAIAFWIGSKRLSTSHPTQRSGPSGMAGTSSVADLRFPVAMLTVAVLLALQNASVLSMHRSWPALLIVWGVFSVLQRAQVRFPAANTPPIDPNSSPGPAAESPLR